MRGREKSAAASAISNQPVSRTTQKRRRPKLYFDGRITVDAREKD